VAQQAAELALAGALAALLGALTLFVQAAANWPFIFQSGYDSLVVFTDRVLLPLISATIVIPVAILIGGLRPGHARQKRNAAKQRTPHRPPENPHP
jgi:ABC-type uncharacterized transport system permease subunit